VTAVVFGAALAAYALTRPSSKSHGHATIIGAPATATTAATPATALTTAPQATTSTVSQTTISVSPPIPLLPNGQPLPALVVFDQPTVTLFGFVPNEATATRLEGLAKQFSADPSSAVIVNRLVINPREPIGEGVRVYDANAEYFASGSAAITPTHAAEFNRLVGAMKLLPNLTVVLIGHADQTGDAATNLALSQARATAVLNYLVSQGISADRLSTEGVGSSDLLSQQSDQANLSLNRRTEFIIYGLLT
jgi:outer membrane protein OmpA-like peptidoglycan-associated protein